MSTITQFPSGNTQYRIEFDYLARTFVVVTLVNSSNPAMNRVLEVGRDYRFLNPTMIEMLVDQSGFDIVRIHRQTGTDLVVDFRNGSVLTASDLTNSELQAIHIAEEGRDQTVDLAKEYADAAGSSAGNAKDSEDEARRIAENIKASGRIAYITRRSFEKGFNVTTWNEVLLWEEDGEYYRWDGTLPKNVPAGSTPESSGGVGIGAWVSVGDASLRSHLISSDSGLGDALVAVKQPVAGSVDRTQHDKNAEFISGADTGEDFTRIILAMDSNTAIGAHAMDSFVSDAVYNTFVGAHAGESIVGDPGDIAIGAENTGVGRGAGRRLTTGRRNVFIGAEAGSLATTASFNIQIGAQSSSASGEKTGSLNTVIGYNAGKNWTSAIRNSFYGSDAGSATTTGKDNVAVGQAAMQDNTTGGGNTYLGAFAGTQTDTGGNNVGIGRSALFRNKDGQGNVAIGREAALGISGSGASPNNTTIIGFQAGWSQNGLSGVVFQGMQAGYHATTMTDTILIGRASGFNLTTGSSNVMIGAASGDSETTGSQLVYLGHGAGRFLIDGTAATAKLNCVAIGYNARVGGNHEIQMGNSSQTVYVYGTVQNRSDVRDKWDVTPSVLGIDFINGLRPVEGVWNIREDYITITEIPTGIVDSSGNEIIRTEAVFDEAGYLAGTKRRTRKHEWFIAQQVAELLESLNLSPDDYGLLQHHSVNGGNDIYTLGYDEFIPPIVNAIQDCWKRMNDLEDRISKLEK